ncbi:MAG TPA: hypothetical protein VH333_08190 [Pseudonocardiaceae bacterium]|jgi:hypothetical protein|nr:hypothetical protein [Pseudonocardiaceae bacterium]
MSTRLRKGIGLGAGAAVIALGMAACGGGTTGTASAGNPTPTPTATTTKAAPTADNASAGGLTAPGTRLAFGQPATVGWVTLDQDNGEGAKTGLKLQVTVESIVKGSLDDFKNIDLDASQHNSTPYYVTVKIKALDSTAPTGDDDPDIVFQAIDDRGQQQESVTFLGTFDRCDDATAPKPFVSGKSYESCLAYLMPGGGSIQSVQWNSGPSAANDVTPYFEKPVVWGK